MARTSRGPGHGQARQFALGTLLLAGVLSRAAPAEAAEVALLVSIGVCEEGRPPFVKAGGFEGLDYDLLRMVGVTMVRGPPRSEGETSVGLCYRLGRNDIGAIGVYRLGIDRTGSDSSPQGSFRVYPRTLM